MAVFPNGIKQFKTHRNVLDDVDASDINAIQDEIVAVQRVLGAGINRDEDKRLFASLADRIQFLEQSRNTSVFELRTADPTPRSGVTNNWAVPTLITFPNPGTSLDPGGLYNGHGITIPVSGFWRLEGFVDFQTHDGHSGPHSGPAGPLSLFIAAITLNDTDWARGADAVQEFTHYNSGEHHFLRPVRAGWIEEGTRVSLRAHHSTSHSQSIAAASLSGFCVRQG